MALQKLPGSSLFPNASSPVPPTPSAKTPSGASPTSKPFWIGLSVSIAWVGVVLLVIAKAGPGRSLGGVALADWALGVSAAVSPVAMVWMVTAYLQRAADIQSIADPLRRQLTLITGESGAADARIRRFNQAIREQIELLRNAQTISQDDLETIMDRVRQHRGELERFESVSTTQVKEIQDVIRRSMLQTEQMMDDKFTMLRVLDGKLQQNGDGVARQVEGMRDQIARMLEDVESTSTHMAETLERATRDGKKLADTARLQESSLTGAAETASETLTGLSSKIDLSVTRFLERASSAREEAERLAHALDAQTRALDDFSGTLPTRVSEAESVLRGVADRLYASEQMAREQAVNLADKLSQQVDGLQSFMDRFTARLSDIDGGLDRRHSDLHDLAERIGSTTKGFVSSWEQSLADLGDRTGSSLQRFSAVNEETRRNADAIAGHLNQTTGKYEEAVVRMRALSSDSGLHMKGMTEEVAAQLAHFEKLNAASAKAGAEVQERSALALQNLQHVLERVLTARDATQTVGESLVKDIYSAVDQNEKMIGRLTEAAQVGARAVGAAAEQLGRQESDIAGKARATEAVLLESLQKLQAQADHAGKSLREQTTNLMNMLAETQSHLVVTDQKLQNFAAQAVTPVHKAVQQIDASAEQGLRSLNTYGEGLNQQVGRLQDFHARVGGFSKDMTDATAQSAAALEQLGARFAAARAQQDETARQTLAQFSELSDRLQREVAGLDGQAATAVETLQQSALKVGEQSYQMLQNAENSSAKIQEAASLLQIEAGQIQATLRQQSEEIGADLSRAEQKFTAIGETIRERAESAYALLDRVSTHYNAVSSDTTRELEDRAHRLEQTVGQAQSRVDYLQASLAQQTQAIDSGAVQIEAHAAAIAATGSRAVQDLSMLDEKMSATHQAASIHAQQTLARLDEAAGTFERRARDINEAADNATGAVVKAGAAFGEQTGKLVDGSHQIDTALRQLTGAAGALAEQAAQIRVGMEQQNSRLLSQLADSVAQMDVTGGKLQQIVTVATQSADQASTRFSDMTDTASRRIEITTLDLLANAERTESTLAALGANITQQAASLSVVGEQIGEQQKILASANDSQRAQMNDLLERLGAAHKQTSDVAERSINYLNASLAEIYRQLGIMSDKSQEAVGTVRNASAGFGEQATLLIQNAQAAEQQARSVLSVTAALQEQAHHLGQSLQDESERASQTLGGLLSRISNGGAELRELGSSTASVFTTLQRALSDQSGELGLSMQQINDRQRSLTAALDMQRDAINGLLNRLVLAQDETAAVAERTALRLGDGAQQIIRHAETIDARAQSAMVTVHAAATGFGQEAEAIESHARQAEQQSRELFASAANFNERIGELRDSMQADGERTTTVMGGILDKLILSSGEMRDIGAATEMSLTTLGHNVEQQTAALTGSMQQISDRQRSLAMALDAQRDVVNGLLNRLTLAQDETAAVAERAAARIGDGAGQIAQQMELIADTATRTMGAVQTTVNGFTEQAGALNMQGQQAEQQMRGMLSVTGGLQEQARQLREAMQADTARVVELLTSVIAQLDATNTQLKTESSAVVHALDQTTQQFSAATKSGTEMIRAQSELLNQTADQSEARMNNAGEKMRGHLKLVSEIGDKTESQARQLADTAEFATTRLVSLRDNLTASDTQGRDILSVASVRIEDVKKILQTEVAYLSELSESAVKQVLAAGETLVTQSDALRSNLAASEAALNAAAELVREETGALPGVLNRSSGEIESVTRALKAYAEEANQSLTGTADRFITVTASARGAMMDEMQRVGAVAADADKVLRHFNRLLAEQAASMLQSTATLSAEQQQLAERAVSSVEALSKASERLTALRGEAAGTTQRLAQEIEILERRTASAGGTLTQAAGGMTQQIEAINDAAARAESRMTGASDGLREQLERIRGGLQGQIEDINRGLMQLTAQLERTGASLRSTTVGSVADVERIGQRFEQTSGEAAELVEARTQQMRSVTEEVERMLTGFGGHFDAMLAKMSSAGEGIKSQEGSFVTQLQGMLGHLGAVAEKLETARTLSGSVSQQAIERLDQVVNAVQAHMNGLANGAQTAAGVMRGVGQIYSEQTQTLTRGVGDAHGQVMVMNKSIGEMQERTDRMRVSLQLQGEELMQSLRQILVQLEMTGDGLSEAVDRTLQQQAEAELQKMG